MPKESGERRPLSDGPLLSLATNPSSSTSSLRSPDTGSQRLTIQKPWRFRQDVSNLKSYAIFLKETEIQSLIITRIQRKMSQGGFEYILIGTEDPLRLMLSLPMTFMANVGYQKRLLSGLG